MRAATSRLASSVAAARRAPLSLSLPATRALSSSSSSSSSASTIRPGVGMARADSMRSSPDTSPETMGVGMRTVESAVNDIVYGFPQQDAGKDAKRHILSVLVDNEPGVLSKVSGLLSARGFNIESLSVCSTDVSDLSRMTIVLQCPDRQMAQVRHQLEDVVSVWAVLDIAPQNAVEREMLMCKIDLVPAAERRAGGGSAAGYGDALTLDQMRARHEKRKMATEIITLFGGRVINVGTEHVIVEVVESSEKIDAIIAMLRPLGIIEAARSGALAMTKSVVSGIYADAAAAAAAAAAGPQKVDDSALPPG